MLQEKGDLEALGQTPVMIDTQCQTSLDCHSAYAGIPNQAVALTWLLLYTPQDSIVVILARI